MKTKQNKASVTQFLNGVKDKQKRADCKAVAKIMREATGNRAKMWGATIIGYGRYDYQYESGRSGSFMITGFSPRAQNITLYIMPGFSKFKSLLAELGKHKTGKSCLYINRLADVDQQVLKKLVVASVKEMRRRYKTA